jgi:hypothetical protein
MDGATMHTPESITAYHRTLEAIYAAYGRSETIINEIGEQLEAEHSRLDVLIEQAQTASLQHGLGQTTLSSEE